jgi:hypothetical protein
MKSQRPAGICTARYECPKGCGRMMYQAPNAVVEHPCSKTKTNIEMKEIK